MTSLLPLLLAAVAADAVDLDVIGRFARGDMARFQPVSVDSGMLGRLVRKLADEGRGEIALQRPVVLERVERGADGAERRLKVALFARLDDGPAYRGVPGALDGLQRVTFVKVEAQEIVTRRSRAGLRRTTKTYRLDPSRSTLHAVFVSEVGGRLGPDGTFQPDAPDDPQRLPPSDEAAAWRKLAPELLGAARLTTL